MLVISISVLYNYKWNYESISWYKSVESFKEVVQPHTNYESARFINEIIFSSFESTGFNQVRKEDVFAKSKCINAKKATGTYMIPQKVVNVAAWQNI